MSGKMFLYKSCSKNVKVQSKSRSKNVKYLIESGLKNVKHC